MIRIQRVYTSVLPMDRRRIEQVQRIFKENFAAIASYADKIPDMLQNPFKYGYESVLLVSESSVGKVTGFSFFLLFPEINSSLLDFMAVGRDIRGSGIGSALYEATQEYLTQHKSRGLYMESLPDDPEVVKDPALLAENRKRLRFYEQYGARPLAGTEYATPIGPSPAPYLLFDPLGRKEPLRRSECRAAIRLILTRKYKHIVSPDYIERVVESVVEDPVRLREPKYIKKPNHVVHRQWLQKPLAMVAVKDHVFHHVREKGYVERPARAEALEQTAMNTGLFNKVDTRHFSADHIRAVHDPDFVAYLKTVCESLKGPEPVYPYVFPIRRPERKPRDLAVRAGYYCIDTFTPLDLNAYRAAREAVDVAMTAAEEIVRGRRVVYALCRPPGHHAERRVFGGFCYFNNAAIAANYLSRGGKVAVLDIDYHHGNGTQDIFYKRNDVLTISIHGHPNHSYPYFSGFVDETGDGEGTGYNKNFPLAENANEEVYMAAFLKAISAIQKFAPVFLVVSIGFDTMKGDPTGSFVLSAGTLRKIGSLLGRLRLYTIIVQEGGYSIRNLRQGAAAFFNGYAEAMTGEFVGVKKPAEFKK